MAKKTVAAKKRNVKVDANGQLHVMDNCMFILLSTTSLFLLQTVKGRSFHGLQQVRWDSEVQRRTLPMQHKWPHKIAPRWHMTWDLER